MLTPHVGVIYDLITLAPRRVIVQDDHEDGTALFDGTHKPLSGEGMAVLQKAEVKGLQLYDIAVLAIVRRTGRQPPSMAQVHAADAQARAARGG